MCVCTCEFCYADVFYIVRNGRESIVGSAVPFFHQFQIWQILKGIIRKGTVATSIILITIAQDRRHICPELKPQRDNNAKPSLVHKVHPSLGRTVALSPLWHSRNGTVLAPVLQLARHSNPGGRERGHHTSRPGAMMSAIECVICSEA